MVKIGKGTTKINTAPDSKSDEQKAAEAAAIAAQAEAERKEKARQQLIARIDELNVKIQEIDDDLAEYRQAVAALATANDEIDSARQNLESILDVMQNEKINNIQIGSQDINAAIDGFRSAHSSCVATSGKINEKIELLEEERQTLVETRNSLEAALNSGNY